MNESQPWTIQRLLGWTADYLRQKSSDSPRLDAEVLLGTALGCPRIELYTRFDQVPPEDALRQFREFVKRRAGGEPVAYIVGQKEFYALPFQVTRDVLIPRPETELLVIETIDRARKFFPDGTCTIVDVGTGSGNIAIALAKHLPQANIVATDQSAAALDVARGNAERLGVGDRIEFLQGDLLEPLTGREPVEFIVSNPPYIGTDERLTLDPTVVEYEPESALFSGPRGTETIEKLLHQAQPRLRPLGWLLVEISPIIAPQVKAMVATQPGWRESGIKKDLAGLERILICRAGEGTANHDPGSGREHG